MKILGICDNHDAGAALVIDNRIIAAVNEERLNRIKNYVGFPYLSIKEVLRISKIKPEEIDMVTVASDITPCFFLRLNPQMHKKNKKYLSQFSLNLKLYTYYQVLSRKLILPYYIDKYLSQLIIKKNLKKIGIRSKIKMVEHHSSHAHAAYKTCPFDKALIISFDAMGDGITLTVNVGRQNRVKRIFQQYGTSEIGYFYSRITELLGFKPNSHEGKITGLAAYGKNRLDMHHFFTLKNSRIYSKYKGKKHYLKLKKFSREDIAASAQAILENTMCNFIKIWIKKTGIKDLVLVSGIFSNVKLNQKIHELDEVKNLYIFPQMGDGGLALGSALSGCNKVPLKDLYLGPEYNKKEIEAVLRKNGLRYCISKDIEKDIASLLSKNKVICRFDKRMEFGPRALGNRSILASAIDKNINHTLNKALKRTEFMPFAPSTLAEYAETQYKNLKGAESSSCNMTISFRCTKKAENMSPAIVHIDGTARPQLVYREHNPSYHKILKEYFKITKIPTILNTSFNMHEEPIVCTPEDAVSSFLASGLDCLAIGNYLVKNENTD